ncbi:hypothetical protein [Micromonospora sp. SL4-19]|uniref:hypothetical protein n=1 Tax=Micromonospora sp. SL4-19 TaxID=3399129 RepID=UPI003A4D90A8
MLARRRQVCALTAHRRDQSGPAAYVKGSNDALEQLAEARDQGNFASLVGLEKSFAFNLSGHVLHSTF